MINRREFVMIGSAAVGNTCLLPISAMAGPVSAGDFGSSILEQYRSIYREADKIKIGTNESAAPGQQQITNIPLNLSQIVSEALVRAKTGDTVATDLADRAGLLLSEINRAVRDQASTYSGAPPSFASLREDYRSLFQSASVNARNNAELKKAARQICQPSSRERYRYIATKTGLPWYMIACLHYREASLNFLGHLHNGDYLKLKTVQVPRGRPSGEWPPLPWDPEQAWYASALDALSRFGRSTEWSVERMLYAFEGYNGWGYRYRKGFRSPYLWNYTQFYRGGGFPRDGVWSDNYQSKQAGLVSLLKILKSDYPDLVSFDFETV